MKANGLAQEALALVGTPFRLHGRDPRTGLDCVGVLAAALAGLGRTPDLPIGYTLRGRSLPDLGRAADACGLAAATAPILPGDVLLVRPGPIQHHLMIAGAADRFVHAHAGLRRVVCGPIQPEWAIVAQWRLCLSE